MDAHVADAVERGARDGGYPTDLYCPATILDGVPRDAEAAREGPFGPIAPIVPVRSLEQAVELTNASPSGLLAVIFAGDVLERLRFADRVRTGLVT
jgi:acyl-CoA reductase-like NAD-dependent aldehyde dehydrogenase